MRPLSAFFPGGHATRNHTPLLHVGCMNFGKRTPEAEATKIVRRAIERGIVVFDTANAYNDGESERILGRALGKDRENVAVATKVGFGRVGGKPEGLRPERVKKSIEESLDRLQTSYVDVYYLHVPDYHTPIDATLHAMKEVLESGKARGWGLSNYASWQILDIWHRADKLGMPEPVTSQQMYNLLVRQLDIEYFRFTAYYPIHTTIYNPLAGGLLTGRHRRDGSTQTGSRFDKNTLYQNRYWTDTFFQALEELRSIADSSGMSMVELSYAWVMQRPGVDSILVGPASVAHLDQAIDACKLRLPEEARTRIDALHRTMVGTDASYAR